MNTGIGIGRARTVLAVTALLATILLGFGLRLVDPLSSPVIPAEDPYTHMAIIRELLRSGDLEPLTSMAGLYPPGLHSFVGAAWIYTGADLYEIIRIGPAFFGAIGILGMALLLWRHAGPVAAFVGALGYAVAPEVIFRTTMMSPTAQDLAILPFFLYALLEVTAGRLAWTAVAGPAALFLVFAHPWLFAILSMMGMVFVALSYLLPFGASAGERSTPRGLAAAIAIVGGGLALTFTSCGGKCGPGWVDIFPELAGFMWASWVLFALAFAPLAILYVLRNKPATEQFLTIKSDRPRWWPVRVAASVAIAGLLFWATRMAVEQGMPPHVALPRMIGWPILGLAAFAVVMIPFLPGRLSHLGAGLFAATYPFVIFNPLNSPFWSHRTAAFLAVSLMILAGVAAAAITRWTAAAIAIKTPTTTRSTRRYVAVVAAFLVAIACAGTVYAGTPDGYEGGWYRMYPACELDGLRDVAALADAEPTAVVIVGGWQPKLVLSALTENSYRVWFAATFYTENKTRDDIVDNLAWKGQPVIVVVERYLVSEHPGSTGFLDDTEEWRQIGSWCGNQGTGQPRLLAYQTTVKG